MCDDDRKKTHKKSVTEQIESKEYYAVYMHSFGKQIPW